MKNYRLYYHEPFKKVVQSRYLTKDEEEKFEQSHTRYGAVDISNQFKYYPYTILGIVELKPIKNTDLYQAHWWSSPYEHYTEECIGLKEAIKYATGRPAKTNDYPLGI